MPRMKILNAAEQMLFDRPPHLSSAERRRIFELPVAVWSAADDIEPSSSRVGFLVSAAYFRSTRRFFPPSDFHDRDITYVAARLRIDGSEFESTQPILRVPRSVTGHKFWNWQDFARSMAKPPRDCLKWNWRPWPSLIPSPVHISGARWIGWYPGGSRFRHRSV